MNILKEIIKHKEQEVTSAKRDILITQLKEMPYYERQCISLRNALEKKEIAVIAEIKKASPSKGTIRKDFDHIEIAREYVSGGAAAISILTDKKYFKGDIRFISDVRAVVPVPILRKDFIIDRYQITEAKAFGSDAVLLITNALEKSHLEDLHTEAEELCLDCIVEVHNEKELEMLNFNQVKIVGINNRNLSDFSVDLSTSTRLASMIPENITIVSESGILNRTDIDLLLKSNINAVLVGESLMRQTNPGEALRMLLGKDSN